MMSSIRVARASVGVTRSQLALRAAPVALRAAPVRWNQQAAAESHLFDDNDALRRRLLYRSKQRGWLEMDIMLGGWVRGANE